MAKANYHILFLLVTFLLLRANGALRGQDGHYWTEHYGTRSMLLSNSVIGGVEDLGAVFYNPARLGLVENPAFLLSADVFEWTRYRVEEAVGDQTTVAKSNFGGVPSVAAGSFNLSFLKGHRFAYALLQRHQTDVVLDYKSEIFGDVIEAFPGEEHFGGYISLNQRLSEQWLSLAWSYPLSDRFSIGLTTNGVLVSQNKGNQIDLQALSEENNVGIYRFNRKFNIDHYGLLWKAGIASNFGKILWGLTVTTPVVSLSGKGGFEYEEFFSGIPGQSEAKDRYTTYKQEDIGTRYRSPWAVGTGFTMPMKRSRLHISGEWYSSIPTYTLLEAENFYSQSNGDTLGFTLIDNLRNVFNVGVGAEVNLMEKLSFYLSFSTDFSAASSDIIGFTENKDIAYNTVFTADYFHYAGGFMLKLRGADIILGATHTGGKQDFLRPVDFPEKGDDNVFEMDESSTLKWSRWRLIFSFSIPFFRDYLDRLGGKKDR